jgi:protein SCO1/2
LESRAVKRALAVIAPVGLGLLFGMLLWVRTAPPERPRPPTGAATYSDFRITTASGALSLSDLRGQVVVLYFGYTSCPDICPTTLATLRRAYGMLSSKAQAQTEVVFVSVDPERDPPDRLAEYVRHFDPSFRAGTAEPSTLEKITRDWGVFHRKVEGTGSAMSYLVDHTTQAFLVGANGELEQVLPHGMPAEDAAQAIRSALP